MMIEKLLQLFVTEVDTNLLKGVVIKNFKPSNVQYTDEVDFFHGRVNQGTVAKIDKPHEETVVHGSRQSSHSIQALVGILSLEDPFRSDLDFGSDEVAIEEIEVFNSKKSASFLSCKRMITFELGKNNSRMIPKYALISFYFTYCTWNKIVWLASLFSSLCFECHFSKMHD